MVCDYGILGKHNWVIDLGFWFYLVAKKVNGFVRLSVDFFVSIVHLLRLICNL